MQEPTSRIVIWSKDSKLLKNLKTFEKCETLNYFQESQWFSWIFFDVLYFCLKNADLFLKTLYRQYKKIIDFPEHDLKFHRFPMLF